jgi:hypothetical protein
MGERRGIARKPATKFANLRKKMEKNKLQKTSKANRGSRPVGR